ncbi:MAG: zf-HC2 domain-containing protein [Chloroflexota bacterium]|nr:zf-HC2 domain-containing protein [Chloroflexota bacterium]
MEAHPRAQLSAYLDGALAAAERAAIGAHLDTCADCRARLAELRTVVSLIGALPTLSPSRRLVPRVAAVPVWMAPLRTLTTLASGLAAFMFIASALLSNVNTLASSTAAQPAAAPAVGGAGTAERNTGTLASATPDNSARSGAAADGATKLTASSAPTSTGSQFQISTTPPQDAAARSDRAPAREPQRPEVPLVSWSPWLWLGLALVLGAIAFALQRRLRSA